MSRPQIVVHRSDAEIDSELEQACRSIGAAGPVFHFSDVLRDTISIAGDFQPVVFMVELSLELEQVRVLVDEVIAVCPDVTVVGICAFGGVSNSDESALMLSALRLGVEDFVRRPISSIDFGNLLSRRISNRRDKKSSPGKLASFVSNKGGVGKSTCAVNVAVELAQRNPERVILIDGSLQMGVCAAHLDIEPQTTITDAWNQKDRLDPQLFKQLTAVHESGLHLLSAPSNAIEAAEIDDAFISRLLLLARRTYDFVIVDTFPLFDRTIMAILDLSDVSFVVTDNSIPTLKSVRGFFQLLSDVGYPEDRWRVLVNRYTTKSGSPSLPDVENYLGRSVDHMIPLDGRVAQSANLGQPLMMSSIRWNKAARQITAIVDSVEAMSDQEVIRDEASSSDSTSNGNARYGEQIPSSVGSEEA